MFLDTIKYFNVLLDISVTGIFQGAYYILRYFKVFRDVWKVQNI